MSNAYHIVRNLFCMAALSSALAAAQNYPAKPIRLLIGAPPGGGNDVLGRVVAQRLTDRIGQQVVVENRGGAGQTIAGEIAAKSPPDGYTVLLVSSSFMIPTLVYPKLPYDTVRDFAGITQIATIPQMLVVHPSLPVKTGPELMISAMLSGDLQVFFSTVPSVQPLAQAGKLKAVAAAVAKRIPTLPDLPTMEEQGVRGMDISGNYGLLVPAATPAMVIRYLNDEVGKVLATPEVRDHLAKQGAFVATCTPAQFQAQVRAEIEKWREVVRISGVKPD